MTRVITDLDDDQSLSIVRTDPKKNQVIPPFSAIGRDGMSRHGIEGINSAQILSTLSGRSSWFFWKLVDSRKYETNLCDLRKVPMSTTEKGRVPRAYTELSKKYLVVRFSKGIYLINPKVILPEFSAYESTWEKWVDACNKRGLPTGPIPLKWP